MAKKGSKVTSSEVRVHVNSERYRQQIRKKRGRWRQMVTRPSYSEFNLRHTLRDCLLGYWRTGSNEREVLQLGEIAHALMKEGFKDPDTLVLSLENRTRAEILQAMDTMDERLAEILEPKTVYQRLEAWRYADGVKNEMANLMYKMLALASEKKNKITQKKYRIFIHRLWDRLPDEEIAARVGVSKQYVNRILAELRRKIGDD